MKYRIAPLVALCLTACAEPGGYYAPPPPPYAPPRYTPPLRPYAGRPAPPPSARRGEAPTVRKVPENVPSAGPLRTAMVGSYMDQQERDLREHLRGTGVGVVRPGDEVVLRLPDAMLFEGHADRLTASGRDALATIAVIARHYDHTSIAVTAYTDGSDKQARIVAGALIADGISLRRITSRSGLAVNTGAKARRIEIRISPQATG
jgi:outer membrane protein OmpA-like peptidoglycan-associated protein